jgi:hypothetical protein
MDKITLLLKLRHEALGAAHVGERQEFGEKGF